MVLSKYLVVSTLGKYEDKNRNIYPMKQVQLELAYMRFIDTHRMRIGVEYYYKPSNNRYVYEHYYSGFIQYFGLCNVDELGLFLKVEKGQDYYNIRFVDRLDRFMVGLNWYLDDFKGKKEYQPDSIN